MRIKKKIYTDKLTFEYFVNVNKDGLFTAYLPEEVISRLEKYGINVLRGRGGRKGFFEARSLGEIEESISSQIQKFSEKKLVLSKIVLRYEIVTNCCYCKTKNGEIIPNGCWDKENKEAGCKWHEGTESMNASSRNAYGFSIYVEPRRLNKWVYPDKTEHREYLGLEDDDIEEGSTLDWLNSVCAMRPINVNEVKDVDYSEEIGLFFKHTILYVCNLNERLKKHFGEEIIIDKKGILLLEKL